MNRAALPLLAWAALLTVLTIVLWLWTSDELPPALFAGAAAISWTAGIVALFVRRPRSAVHVAPDLSLAGALLAFGVAALVLGALVGPWLVLIGAGIVLLALGGLAREWRAQRRVR